MSTPSEEIWALLREVSQSQKETAQGFEEIKRLFKETDRKFWEMSQETDRKFQETDHKFQETDRKFWEMSQETDRKFQETDRQFEETKRLFQETDHKFQETDRQFREMREEADRRSKETDQRFRQTDKKLNKLEALFTSQWGKLMESLVAGDLVSILTKRGIPIQETSTRVRGKLPQGGHYEFDIVAHNGDAVVVVEVKTTLRSEDVTHFVNKLNHLKIWVPRYCHNTIYGAMAWLNADASVDILLEKQGLFSIRATGKSAQVVSPADFQPHIW